MLYNLRKTRGILILQLPRVYLDRKGVDCRSGTGNVHPVRHKTIYPMFYIQFIHQFHSIILYAPQVVDGRS